MYHTAGLLRTLKSVVLAKKKKKIEKYKQKLSQFREKYSVYAYHVKMAIHALKNPFTNEGLIHRPSHFTSDIRRCTKNEVFH